MSNQYFRFKQFHIDQERCAMKVTTDACIQGAWTLIQPGVKRVLDIGTGTGLLSLMLAQRAPGITIDAIEYDAAAAAQASDNVAASPWAGSINVITGDVRDYTSPEKYDLIITNPPFFNNSLLSTAAGKNMARHTTSLSYTGLLKAIDANLAADGYASILLPYTEYLLWKELLDNAGWFQIGKLSVRHRAAAAVKRVVCLVSRHQRKCVESELIIQDADGKYTKTFADLLETFYLTL